MVILVLLATIAAFGLAGYLWWKRGTPIYLVALLAGMFGTFLSPLWQALYQYSYDLGYSPLFEVMEHPLPWVIFLGGWILMLPPLFALVLYQLRIWSPGYLSSILVFVMFVGIYLIFELIGARIELWFYTAPTLLPFGFSMTALGALMQALVGLALLSALILTRRYAWLSLLMILLPMPLVFKGLVYGLLGAPLYAVFFLTNRLQIPVEPWAAIIAFVGTLGLLLAGAHTVATVLAGQQRTAS